LNRSYRLILLATLIISLFLLSTGVAEARIIWVATDGSDINGDGSFGLPFQTIHRGLELTSDVGDDTVMVRAGTYGENYGSEPWSFPPWTVALVSQDGAASTTIDLTGTASMQIFDNGKSIIDGFTITNADASGIYILGYDTTPITEVKNCMIVNNGLKNGFLGGGIRVEYANPNIHDNVIRGNSVLEAGGGIYGWYCFGRIWNNEISNNAVLNTDGEGGGGIFITGTGEVDYCLVQNNLFLGNRVATFYGGGMFIETSSVLVLNNLFYGNDAGSGGALFIRAGFLPYIANNVFTNNSLYAINCNATTFPPQFSGNAFFMNLPDYDEDFYCVPNPDSNIFGVDPQFVDAGNSDFHLQETSPLINAGATLAGVPYLDVDYDGGPRVIYLRPDIGPYEFIDCSLSVDFSFEPAVVCTSQVVTFSLLSSDLWQEARWDYGNGQADTVHYGDIGYQLLTSYDSPGTYDVVLTLITDCDTAVGYHTVEVMGSPDASFIHQGQPPFCAPHLAAFTVADTSQGLSYSWDFGDGTSSTLPDPQHLYDTSGTYQITLILTNDCGADTSSLSFDVLDVPQAYFAAITTSGTAPLTVYFSDNSEPSPTGWQWDFGDGRTSSEQNPAHTYTVPGIYDVGLSASNVCGSGTEYIRSGYITVSGFNLTALEADTSDKLQQVFPVVVDSLFASYDGLVALSTLFSETPRRGGVSFQISDDTVSVPDTVMVTALLDMTLAQGQYDFSVIGKSVVGEVTDTVTITFRSWPDTLIQLAADTLRFAATVVDSSLVDSLKITNVGPFIPPLELLDLNILSSGTDNTAFVVTNPASSEPIPTNGGVYYMRIRFTPSDTGTFEGVLDIQSDDPAAPILSVVLIGQGIEEFYPPTVVSTMPSQGELDVTIRAPIMVQLSEEIDSTSFTPTTVSVHSDRLGGAVAGTSSLVGGDVARFVPSGYYPPFDTISVTVSSLITDLVGNGLDGNLDGIGSQTAADDFTFSFYVGPAVYPGDCNNDGIVNEVDVLPIGVYFGLTGPNRDQFDEGTIWGPKQALVWADPAVTYADADGNGVVDENDLLVLAFNWGNEHEWANNTMPIDFNYQQYSENFARLRMALTSMAGSAFGDQLLRMIDAVAPGGSLPTDISLEQNYPNPFNPMTRIDYALPEGTEVHLTVHNILGQTVKTLVDGYQEAGYKNVIWYGDDETGAQVSSGVYFYRLDAGGRSQIRKMLKLQ
jgi:PKD repeat protein